MLKVAITRASDPVNRIMSAPVVTIGPDEPVSVMVRLFEGHPIHHLPVVEGRRVVGMLGSADLLKLAFFLPDGPAGDVLLNDRWRVKAMMRSPVVVVTEHESVQCAAELMTVNGIHSLPVVDANGELTGIVTATDILKWCLAADDAHACGAVSAARVRSLEQVASAAKRYVNAGQDEHLHAALCKAIERADELDERARHALLGLGVDD